MNKREQKFTTKFSRWLKYKYHGETAILEIKVTTTDSLPFAAVSDKQKRNLIIGKKKYIHKFSDALRWGTDFDMVYMKEPEAYVVIYFSKPKNKEFFMCPIDSFLAEEHLNERKSLTEERSRDICVRQEFN